MKHLKIAHGISAIGCLKAVPFIFSPWEVLEDLIEQIGIDPLPRAPVFIYFFRVVCGLFGLIGLFFVLLTRNPMGYGRMLELGGYDLLIFGMLALTTGASLGIPLIVYFCHGLFGVILGTLISILSSKLQRPIQ